MKKKKQLTHSLEIHGHVGVAVGGLEGVNKLNEKLHVEVHVPTCTHTVYNVHALTIHVCALDWVVAG